MLGAGADADEGCTSAAALVAGSFGRNWDRDVRVVMRRCRGPKGGPDKASPPAPCSGRAVLERLTITGASRADSTGIFVAQWPDMSPVCILVWDQPCQGFYICTLRESMQEFKGMQIRNDAAPLNGNTVHGPAEPYRDNIITAAGR